MNCAIVGIRLTFLLQEICIFRRRNKIQAAEKRTESYSGSLLQDRKSRRRRKRGKDRCIEESFFWILTEH
jgi:hypothetical protein